MSVCPSAEKFNIVTTMGAGKTAISLISSGNILFRQSWSKKSKLLVHGEIRYLDYFDFEEFNGDVHFF